MPNDPGYLLDHESLRRISEVVRAHGRRVPGEQPDGSDPGPDVPEQIEITGAKDANGEYPAYLKWFDDQEGKWYYGSVQILAYETNGVALSTGSTYTGVITRGRVVAGEVVPVYAVQAGGGGGGGSTFFVVKATTTLPPILGVISTYNEISKTWSDGTASVELVEANGNVIPTGKRVLAMKSGNVYIVGLDPVAVTSVVCNSGTLTVVGRN